MGEDVRSQMIEISALREHQKLFQKEISELISLYLLDGNRKIAAIKKALAERNWQNFIGAVQELRYRSIDIGAHRFSFNCLNLEIAATEMRLGVIPTLISRLETKFIEVQRELERIQQNALYRKLTSNS